MILAVVAAKPDHDQGITPIVKVGRAFASDIPPTVVQ